jgi:hypothetical protein
MVLLIFSFGKRGDLIPHFVSFTTTIANTYGNVIQKENTDENAQVP